MDDLGRLLQEGPPLMNMAESGGVLFRPWNYSSCANMSISSARYIYALGLQPYPQKVVRPPWHPPQPPNLRRWARSPFWGSPAIFLWISRLAMVPIGEPGTGLAMIHIIRWKTLVKETLLLVALYFPMI